MARPLEIGIGIDPLATRDDFDSADHGSPV